MSEEIDPRTGLSQEQAANMPLPLRIAAYAQDQGLDRLDAMNELLELGLECACEEAIIEHGKDWRPPIYLWASYKRLLAKLPEEESDEQRPA